MARVLLVDDEPGVLFALESLLTSRGDAPVVARSGEEALASLDGVDAVVSDFAMPGMNGLELLRAIRERDPALPVILLTAHGSERIAVQAIRSGAYEYVTKPFDIDELSTVLDRALEARALRVQNRQLQMERSVGRRVVGRSAAMQRLLALIARLAPRDLTVLVRGETGTGKELVASLLHAGGHRAERPLVRFNCAAIPPELAEAELFGHARGAFTGATQARRGFFGKADGGTLVLDEIGELPAGVQAKLLRVLQDGEIQPVGTGTVERVDVRVVASTNRDLAAEARAGKFREDLYYRLAVVELVVPPLRERREDIPELAAEFARRYGERFELPGVTLAPELLDRLARADWPGNVRQLESCVARMVALGGGEVIGPEAFEAQEGAEPATGEGTLHQQLEALERSILARMLSTTSGNQSEAARRLGVSRTALIDRIKKYGLSG
ncbi:sigma-54-dependent transcriptional regulator [Anaeromyxobacter paludicola]|uniref:Acetoacetate metabolism regulatory protein AtoC n=1 Tax=Anaeromyxobacter paludicola TaxID=2918171 RepID=A0ABM7XDU9_9BACT|nr:sigma-54 dependent transcriptional regulator [Anaeromyxobacter paludicola]BDG10046.1 acetoacetate metabolism regulatory protein AtoC [Anaeromyxobacter paludicola]